MEVHKPEICVFCGTDFPLYIGDLTPISQNTVINLKKGY